jgi:hypothetical protein
MISHKHRFIFIHIPKTAGTSIEEALRDESCQLLPGEWDHGRVHHTPLNHLTLQEVADYGMLTPAQLKSYFKFCFVRNPWDRLVSEIFCPWMSPWFKELPVDQRIRRACELATTTNGIGNHLRLQQDFVDADGLPMDFVGRFEHLDEDFDQLCRLLGIEAALPHRNRSAHRPYQEYYDEQTQALAAATYRRDIEAFQYQFGEASGGRMAVQERQRNVDERASKGNGNRIITAYPLVDKPAPLQPAAETVALLSTAVAAERANANRQGWQLCCPVAFEATWNGGPKAEDIEIRLAEDATAQPAFVQSNLGEGLLTFYPGYQFKTADDHLLWVRGPVNAPKAGLSPLESLVDASLLPCAVAIDWQFTRPHQTIHFAAGEPFATLLLYPKAGLEAVRVEMMQADAGEQDYAQAFQQMIAAPALQTLFQRLGAGAVEPMPQGPELRGR